MRPVCRTVGLFTPVRATVLFFHLFLFATSHIVEYVPKNSIRYDKFAACIIGERIVHFHFRRNSGRCFVTRQHPCETRLLNSGALCWQRLTEIMWEHFCWTLVNGLWSKRRQKWLYTYSSSDAYIIDRRLYTYMACNVKLYQKSTIFHCAQCLTLARNRSESVIFYQLMTALQKLHSWINWNLVKSSLKGP